MNIFNLSNLVDKLNPILFNVRDVEGNGLSNEIITIKKR